MNRRDFLASAVAVPIAARASTIGISLPGSQEEEHPGAPAMPVVEPTMARYLLTLHRVLEGTGPAYTPDFLLADLHGTPGRRFTDFSGDVSGRWIGALATASAAYGQSFPLLDAVVQSTIASQQLDGYFGKIFHFDHPDDEDMALLWGNGRLLVGLMEYYALTQNLKVLESAKKLGNFLVRIAPDFNSRSMAEQFGAAHFASSYICWTQQTEGLAALYAVTRDQSYRDVCAAISERMERRPADHVHGYLCSLRGTVDLYHATGNRAHLQRVETAWEDISSSGDILLTGGVPEAWSPNKKRTEGCAECDWLRLNLSLWHATSNPRYLDAAERILFNDFSMNQFASGDFGHAKLNDDGTPLIVYVRAWWCCTLHGLRTFPDIHRSVFRAAGGSVFYDLPTDGHFDNADVSAQATSRLALDGTVRIRIKRISPGQVLTLRRPPWVQNLTATVGGKAVAGLDITNLKAGDVVTATYKMKLVERLVGDSHRFAFFYGPWLLAAPSSANPGYFNELHQDNILMQSSAQPERDAATSPFDVPIARTTVRYSPAEFPGQPASVRLRAVAEQTATLPTQWQTTFVKQDPA